MRLSALSRSLVVAGLPALFTALLAAPAAAAVTLLVPEQFPTIQAAVDAALPGDTVAIASGVYFENVVIPFGLDGLTLQGKGSTTVLDGCPLGSAGAGDALVIDGCDDVAVRSLVIRNARAGGEGAYSYGVGIDASGDGLVIEKVWLLRHQSYAVLIDGDDAKVTGCFVNGSDGGIEVDGDNALVTKCTVTNDLTAGIGVSGDGGTVSKCKVANISDTGIWVEGSDATVTGCTAFNAGDDPLWGEGDNLTFTKNTVQGGVLDEHGLRIEDGVGGLIAGNKFLDVASVGVGLSPSTSGIIVQNNQFTGGGLGFPLVVLEGDDHVFSGNTLSGGGEDGVIVHGDRAVLGVNKLVRMAGHGFRLAGTANDTLVQQNTFTNCATYGLFNSGLGTQALDNTFKGNRLDVASDGSFAVFTGNVYLTGGPDTPPEP